MTLSVYFCSPAPVARAHWLQSLLQPVCEAARIDQFALEIRPTGRWAGWCSPRASAPDGRVILSNKICFWSKESVIDVYLHEVSHRLLSGREVQSHGGVFFVLNSALMARCAAFFESDTLIKMSLYDMQDCPPELDGELNWRSLVLSFAIETIALLKSDECPADELPEKIEAAWVAWLARRAARLKADVEQARKARQVDILRDELAVSRRINSLHFWFLTSLFFVGFISFVWFVAREFTR